MSLHNKGRSNILIKNDASSCCIFYFDSFCCVSLLHVRLTCALKRVNTFYFLTYFILVVDQSIREMESRTDEAQVGGDVAEELDERASDEVRGGAGAVSYTHLTLPTIYSV